MLFAEIALMSAVKKILVVDDDKSIGDALSRAFATKGFAVTICGKAVDALEKLKVDEFCAIFVDCMLPQLSGVDLVAKITEGNMSSSPIYLMSGVYKDKRYIKDAMIKSHAAEFITKPFNLEDVLKLVVSTSTDKTELSRPPLFRVFSDISANSRDIRKAIDSLIASTVLICPLCMDFWSIAELPATLMSSKPKAIYLGFLCFLIK